MKKPSVFTCHTEVHAFLASLSKAALADLVLDLVRRGEGDESLDGPEMVRALRKAARPVLRARGDRLASAARRSLPPR